MPRNSAQKSANSQNALKQCLNENTPHSKGASKQDTDKDAANYKSPDQTHPTNDPKTLIIYLSYAGLGDSMFYSHLPRIAKTANKNGGGITIESISSPFLTSAAMITKGSFGRQIPMWMAF